MELGGISIHVGRLVTGIGLIGTLLSPAAGMSGSIWERASAVVNKLATDEGHQRNVAVAGLAYVGVRAIGPSVEKKPLIELGKFRVYAL